MSGWFLVSTRQGVLSFVADGPDDAWRLQGRALDGEWVWLTRMGVGDPKRAFAGTREGGLFWTQDGGERWEPLGEAMPPRYVRGLAIHPAEPEVLYVGTEPAGVWRQDLVSGVLSDRPVDGVPTFPTWSFPDPPHIAHVKDLVADPWVRGGIFAAVEVGGVLRSDDGGERWVERLDGIDTDAHFLAVDPHRQGRVYCATGKSVYLSDDRGDRWRRIATPLSRRYTSLLMVHPTIADRVYVAASDGPPPEWFVRDRGADAGLYVSEDGGASFVELRGGLPPLLTEPITALVVDPADPHTLHLGIGDGTIWVSHDLGEHWSCARSGLPPIQHISAVSLA